MHGPLCECSIYMVLQAFVSEYAVWKEDAANGSLLAAIAEAAFLIGLEKNRFSITFFSIVYCVPFMKLF